MTTVEQILMVKGPATIVADPSTTVFEAARLMTEDNVGAIIVREGNVTEGIFTERDLMRRVVAVDKDPKKLIMSEVMSSPVSSCRLGDDIRHCSKILTESRIRHLAVIEDGVLVGLISSRDIQAAEIHDDEQQIEELLHVDDSTT
jgi:CBS domain-containing protein